MSSSNQRPANRGFRSVLRCAISHYRQSPSLSAPVKAGGGFTAAFGYAFKEGFSTEMEWGYQKIRTDNPTVKTFSGQSEGKPGLEASAG